MIPMSILLLTSSSFSKNLQLPRDPVGSLSLVAFSLEMTGSSSGRCTDLLLVITNKALGLKNYYFIYIFTVLLKAKGICFNN